MGQQFPKYPNQVSDGDEPSYSPNKTQNSLLGVERGTDYTRRLETDTDSNLHVSVSASPGTAPATVSPLAGGSVSSVTANTLTTVCTYTATGTKRVTRIGCSGTCYAKFTLVINTVVVETKRSGPQRNIDFTFDRPLLLSDSDILDLKVTHFVTGETNEFEATVYGG